MKKGAVVFMKLNLTKITKVFLDIMFVGGVLVSATLPVLLKPYSKYMDPQVGDYMWQIIVLLDVCGVFALLIIWELRKMFKTVIADDCFVRTNVTSLSRMGNYSFVIAAVMLVRCVAFYVTLAAISMVLVFIIAGFFSKVLAQVFDKAVSYKLENDFTI